MANVCIYWDTQNLQCTANQYFTTASITCYNDGHCDGSGTCDTCSKYDVGGLKYWYITGDGANTQVPMNLIIYNLRAFFRKCCHWSGAPTEFSLALAYDPVKQQYIRIPTPTSTSKCQLAAASPWWSANTAENPYRFPCNGAKDNCPYYTGPKWTYCVDSKMESGDKISAAQILELMYYSRDWWTMSDPEIEWNKVFKHPDVWAWSGEYEFGGDQAAADAPMIQKVSVDSFDSAHFSLTYDPPVPATRGVAQAGGVPDYPTLIWQLQSSVNGLRVLWPDTTSDDPFVFRTFRIGQEYVWVIVYVPDEGNVYAVNQVSHPQGSTSDTDFLAYMDREYPEDLFSASVSSPQAGVVFLPIKLEHTNAARTGFINHIKIYYQASGSSSIDSESVYVKHKFYHGMIAQTSSKDVAGVRSADPIVVSMPDVETTADIWNLTSNTSVGQVFWEALPSGQYSVYAIEELVQDQAISDWTALDCKLAAITIEDTRCSHVIPWRLTGTCRGVSLGVKAYRSGNPKLPTGADTEIDLEVYYKSDTGLYMPGNVVLVVIPSKLNTQPPLDPAYDELRITYCITEYKHAPVAAEDIIKLKYPELRTKYMNSLPIELSTTATSVSLKGPRLKTINGTETKYISNTDMEMVRDLIVDDLLLNESLAVQSFAAGGLYDDQVETHTEIFARHKDTFEANYDGFTFESDGVSVTLERACERLSEIGNDEGDYKIVVVFNDETGRPIGIKRAYMLLQSASVQMRDAEIYYSWQMNRQFWLIEDQYFLLARYAKPLSPGTPNGVEVYTPNCGDHSHQLSRATTYSEHTYGDPGPMWYPYNRCLMPSYHRTDSDDAVKCASLVEGFGNDGDYYGKRFSYWERMRGPDVFRAVILFPITTLGCYYRSVDGNWQSIDEQNFTGYTKIRSCHPNGPYGKDREAAHLNRHFQKRNLKVRRQYTDFSDDENLNEITDEFSELIYGPTGNPVYGADSELPVWVHMNDSVSEVSRTTDEAQHPFSHYILDNSGSFDVSEEFSSTRYKLSEVVQERDLTQSSDGSSISVPVETSFSMIEGMEEVGDIIWTFVSRDTVWAWLERPKDPVRGTPRVGGVHLFPPVQTVWKKNLESAVFPDEGSYVFSYTAPTFSDQGALLTNPKISLGGGPEITINWLTGALTPNAAYSKTTQDLAGGTNEPFRLFGLGSDGSSFIADNSGLHRYVRGYDGDDLLVGRTFRGLAMSSNVHVPSLPYELKELFTEYPALMTPIRPKISGPKLSAFIVSTKGYKYIERVEVEYIFGGVYDIPTIGLFYYDSSGQPQNVQSGNYKKSNGAQTTRSETYTIASMGSGLLFQFGNPLSQRSTAITSLKIWYREPVDRDEEIQIYERKVNKSTGDTGATDYRELLYYYSRVYLDTGSSINDEDQFYFLGRNIKDVILEYEFYDPRELRFGNYTALQPNTIANYAVDTDSIPHVNDTIEVHTKGRTLITGTHKTDVMDQYVSPDETVSFADQVGKHKLYERAQQGLYDEAKSLLGGETSTTYTWFWHPDEISFFETTLGISDFSTRFTCQLTLTSQIASLDRVWRYYRFGCSANLSSPHGTGRIHYIDKWRALGHWIYAGNPMFNETCYDVILFKVGEHIGEDNYGTDNYRNIKISPQFPWETPKSREYYQQRGLIQKRSEYWGGSMGGPGNSPFALLGGGLMYAAMPIPGSGQAEVESEVDRDSAEWSSGKWTPDAQPNE